MKTNQLMIRDKKSFIQRTSDSYFNATKLLDTYNTRSGNKPIQLGNYKNANSTIEFIKQLKSEGIPEPIKSSRGKTGGTWMHPKLFIDFAMYVSVEFKSIVIDYVLDGLIKSRHDAGDYYNEMCASILARYVDYYGKRPNPAIFQQEARKIKSLLGLSKKDRNQMSEDELKAITQLQKLNSLLIERGVARVPRHKQLEIQAELIKM